MLEGKVLVECARCQWERPRKRRESVVHKAGTTIEKLRQHREGKIKKEEQKRDRGVWATIRQQP